MCGNANDTKYNTNNNDMFASCVCVRCDQASVPYLEMLETWIYHGDLNDQYGEGSIVEMLWSTVLTVALNSTQSLFDRPILPLLPIIDVGMG